LREMPGVADAMVVARDDQNRGKRLIACIVPAEQSHAQPKELRALLSERFPDHMLPSEFLIMDRLPRTATGKLDRGISLLAHHERRPQQLSSGAQTALEETLCRLWAQVIGVDSVCVNDNFFELGGDSLHATQLVSQVRRAFGIELSVRQFFEAPTPARLASVIESAYGSRSGSQAGILDQVERLRPSEVGNLLRERN
jgi:acyl carrier protein